MMYTVRKEDFVSPSSFIVICQHPYDQPKGPGKFLTHRVGGYSTLVEARQAAKDDLKAMADTYGGLMAPVGTEGRTYRIFKATYEEVS